MLQSLLKFALPYHVNGVIKNLSVALKVGTINREMAVIIHLFLNSRCRLSSKRGRKEEIPVAHHASTSGSGEP